MFEICSYSRLVLVLAKFFIFSLFSTFDQILTLMSLYWGGVRVRTLKICTRPALTLSRMEMIVKRQHFRFEMEPPSIEIKYYLLLLSLYLSS